VVAASGMLWFSGVLAGSRFQGMELVLVGLQVTTNVLAGGVPAIGSLDILRHCDGIALIGDLITTGGGA